MDSCSKVKPTVSSDGPVSKVPSLAEAMQCAACWLNVHRV